MVIQPASNKKGLKRGQFRWLRDHHILLTWHDEAVSQVYVSRYM